MALSNFLQKLIEEFKADKVIYDRVTTYFERNDAVKKYANVQLIIEK